MQTYYRLCHETNYARKFYEHFLWTHAAKLLCVCIHSYFLGSKNNYSDIWLLNAEKHRTRQNLFESHFQILKLKIIIINIELPPHLTWEDNNQLILE